MKATAIEKIRKVLEKSPYTKGDNIKGSFVWGDNSIEFTLGHGMNSESYMFTKEGDLLLTITPRES